MTALDLGTANRVLTPPSAPFSTVPFGDVNLIPDSAPHAVTTFGDILAIPRAESDGNSDLVSDGVFTPAQHFATFIAMTGPSVGSPGWSVVYSPMATLYLTNGAVSAWVHGWQLADTVAMTNGDTLMIFAIANGSTGSRLVTSADGVLATETEFGDMFEDSVNVQSFGDFVTPDPTARVMGMWYFDDVDVSETDLVDTIDAIAATFAPPAPTAFSAAFTFPNVDMASEFTAGDPEPEIAIEDLPEPGGDVEPPEPPEPGSPEALRAAGIEPIRHVWERMPAPTLDERGNPIEWEPTAAGSREYGFLQIVINDEDVTIVDGVPTPEPSWSDVQPFGFQACRIDTPTVHAFAARPSWTAPGANVLIRLALLNEEGAPTGEHVVLFRGIVLEPSTDEDSGVAGLDCIGIAFQADLQKRKPIAFPDSRDIGAVIAESLNGVIGHRYGTTAKVTTGIRTATSGGWEEVLTGYIQKLLATALKDGKQWTVDVPDATPIIRHKDTTTVHLNVYNGQRGVKVEIASDASTAPNAIYCQGVNPKGGRWMNWKYQGWHPDDTPLFPLDVSDWFRIGLHDSGTISGRGVSDAQDKLGRPVTKTWNRGDVTALRRFQERAGVTVDGELGPQSWAALFNTGGNTGDLKGRVFPLAVSKEVEPRLYGPDGDDLGPNPHYNPSILRVEAYYNVGQGVYKYDGARWAREVLARDSKPGWAGTITWFDGMSPEEMPAEMIRAGMNIQLHYHNGATRLLHIAAVDKSAGRVRVTVDTKARDYPTLEAILERDRAAVDPAKVALQRLLKGNTTSDRPEYDAESKGGRMPRHAVNGGFWECRPLPLGEVGEITMVDWYTDNPTTFALAFFSKDIKPNKLLDVLGNPLTADENPWEDNGELDKLGLIQGWGFKDQPCGKWPKTAWNYKGARDVPTTGRLRDDTSFTYATSKPPYIFVAMFTAADCYAWGRVYGKGEW